MRNLRFALAALLPVLATACHKRSYATPEITWIDKCDYGGFACAKLSGPGIWGQLDARLEVKVEGREYVAILANAPLAVGLGSGTREAFAKADEHDTVTGGDLHVPVGDRLGAISLADVFTTNRAIDPELTLTVILPDGARIDTKVPPLHFGRIVRSVLTSARTAPLTFAGDAPRAQHTVLFDAKYNEAIVGPAKTVAEIDWVAVREEKAGAKVDTCNYRDDRGVPTSVDMNSVDELVTIYDRRTGKPVDSKLFTAAATACPSYLSSHRDITASVDAADETTWLTARVGQTVGAL